MKLKFYLLMLAIAVLSSMSLFAQNEIDAGNALIYEGRWPAGEGVLYSHKDGLIMGTFVKGVPEGRCICYKLNGEVFWGDFRKGKATGNGRLYRDNGIVVCGGYRNGVYHGVDTLYRKDGSVMVGKFSRGKLKKVIADTKFADLPPFPAKPEYPRVNFTRKQETFICDLELLWEERNMRMAADAGLISPRFRGGDVEDFALWVNSQVVYPLNQRQSESSRTVLVEFTVTKEGEVADVHAVFGSNPVLNEAAEEAVRKSPKWEPAEQRGEKKNVRLTVPVIFNN
jgi:TonB family protein